MSMGGVCRAGVNKLPHWKLSAWEGQAVLTTEDRSTFSTLLSCSSTGCRPATWSCTEDVRYTKLSSQSPLWAEKGVSSSLRGAPGQGWGRLVGLVLLWETRAVTASVE